MYHNQNLLPDENVNVSEVFEGFVLSNVMVRAVSKSGSDNGTCMRQNVG